MTSNFFTSLVWQADSWHWWVLGMVLLGIEVFAPGFFFLWFGVAAGVVGLILVFDPSLAWQYQVIIYAVMSLVSIMVWRIWLRRLAPPTDQPALNRRAAQYVGRLFTLEKPIINGRGRIHVDDTWWRVEGKDLPTGSLVRVVAADGVVLRVERAERLEKDDA
jgi:hypothetical protein